MLYLSIQRGFITADRVHILQPGFSAEDYGRQRYLKSIYSVSVPYQKYSAASTLAIGFLNVAFLYLKTITVEDEVNFNVTKMFTI